MSETTGPRALLCSTNWKEYLFLPDYLEVQQLSLCRVCVWSWSNFSACIDIVLIFFSYSGPSGILGSDGKQNTLKLC